MDMLSSAAAAIPGFGVGPGPAKKGKAKKTTRGVKTGAVGKVGSKASPFQKAPTAKGKAGSKAKASAKTTPAKAAKAPFKRTLGKAAGSFKRNAFKRGSSSGGGY